MRVYEYAKKNNKSSKDILAALSAKGFVLANHMAHMTDEMLGALAPAPKPQVTTSRPSYSGPRSEADRGERKPYPPRDGERKPYPPRDGERKPYPPRDGERKPYPPRDGERKPYPPRDGERKPYPPRDGERKPYPPRDGERKPYPPRNGERKPYPPRDGERKPYPPRDGASREGFVRREGAPGQQGQRPSYRPPVPDPNIGLSRNKGPEDSRKNSFSKDGASRGRHAEKSKGRQRDDVDEPSTTVKVQNHRISRETIISEATVSSVTVKHELSLSGAAALFRKPVGEVVFAFLKKGLARNIFAVLPVEELVLLGEAFGIEVVVEKPAAASSDVFSVDREKVAAIQKEEQRLPVVVVMGHVDHGKTTLLDYLRKTNVVAREKGGITQHLSAYEVKAGARNVIFLDTPGHEAFSHMRTKGTRITDIAVIIVSAVEGIKPQTVEVVQLAKQAGVPILVAINKIDRLTSESQIETLYTQLSQHGLTPEEWGGETVCVRISAKTGEGVENLLEMLGLMSDLLDLKTSSTAPADAFVLESRLVKGHGLVVTVICRQGTLRKGDFFLCGNVTGRVRLLIDSAGNFVESVGPSVPVQVVGFDENSSNSIGDYLEVLSHAEYAERKASLRRPAGSSGASQPGGTGESNHEIRLMCKTDMQGSCQAVVDAIAKMEKSPRNSAVKITLFSCEVGPISENDVVRASDLKAHLFGLHVRPDKNAQIAAKARHVDINQYDIIYHMFEHIERLILEERRKIVRLVPVGKAEVLKLFPIKNHKVIVGCLIKEGVLKVGDKVECIRAKQVVGAGIVMSLQRDRREVKEVREGYDCGFLTDVFHAWQVGDRIAISTHEHLEEE